MCLSIGCGATRVVHKQTKLKFKDPVSIILPDSHRQAMKDATLTIQNGWVRGEAHLYLHALLIIVMYANKDEEWEAYSEATRCNSIQICFLDGKDNRIHRLIIVQAIRSKVLRCLSVVSSRVQQAC